MFRRSGNGYYGVNPPQSTTVFSSEREIELVQMNEDPVSQHPDGELPKKKPFGCLCERPGSRLIVGLVVGLIIVVVVVGMVVTTFIVSMTIKSIKAEISLNSRKIEGLTDQLRLQLEAINARIQYVPSNWSDHVTLRPQDDVRIKLEQIDSSVQRALANWSEENIPRLKDELRVRPEEIDATVNNTMTKWINSNLPKLKDEVRVKPKEIDNRVQVALSNWSGEAVQHVIDDVRIKPEQMDSSVQRVLANWSEENIPRLKHELRVRPEEIGAAVNNTMTKWINTNLPKLKDEVKVKTVEIDNRVHVALSNWSGEAVQQVIDDVRIKTEQIDSSVQRTLANWSEENIPPLKESLKRIDVVMKETVCYMGMKSGQIPDSAITSSTKWDANHAAHLGRLDNQRSGSKRGAWNAKTREVGQWIQVDLGKPEVVAGVITQGRPEHYQWVTSYKVSCGNVSSNMTTIPEHGQDKVFSANTDVNTKVVNKFPQLMTCRYIRIYPQTYKNWMSMRFEIIRGICMDIY